MFDILSQEDENAASPVKNIANPALRACSKAACCHTRFCRCIKSMRPSVSIFVMQAPNKSPAARSGASSRLALTVVNTSGSDVAPAISTTPIQSPQAG